MNKLLQLITRLGLGAGLILLAGCGFDDKPDPNIEQGPALHKVILQTDWYAQPEHAGFYYAQAAGYYADAGLDVEIRPGANMTGVPQLIATKRIQFALGTSDNMLMAASRGIPLVAVFPYFQHDPQCVMTHKSTGITELSQLDGRTVMISPGAGYVQYLQKTLGIRLQIVPLDYSLTRFLADPEFIQQCFLTNEPYYVEQQGIEASVIPMSTSGFDPYRLVYSNAEYVAENPDIVNAFIEASKKGWNSYMQTDGQVANQRISALNPQHTEDSMTWTKATMEKYRLIDGYAEEGEYFGRFERARVEEQISQLTALDMLDGTIDLEKTFPLGFSE